MRVQAQAELGNVSNAGQGGFTAQERGMGVGWRGNKKTKRQPGLLQSCRAPFKGAQREGDKARLQAANQQRVLSCPHSARACGNKTLHATLQ